MLKTLVRKHRRNFKETRGSIKNLGEQDLMHPNNLVKIKGAADRYGECKERAMQFAHKYNAKVFSRGDHVIALFGGYVYDYVLSPSRLLPEKQYFDAVDGIFVRQC